MISHVVCYCASDLIFNLCKISCSYVSSFFIWSFLTNVDIYSQVIISKWQVIFLHVIIFIPLSVIWTFFSLTTLILSSFIYIISINEFTRILKIIGHRDVKHIMTLPIKSITSGMNVSTYIFTSITARPSDNVFLDRRSWRYSVSTLNMCT